MNTSHNSICTITKAHFDFSSSFRKYKKIKVFRFEIGQSYEVKVTYYAFLVWYRSSIEAIFPSSRGLISVVHTDRNVLNDV